jgi:hypothetical protein
VICLNYIAGASDAATKVSRAGLNIGSWASYLVSIALIIITYVNLVCDAYHHGDEVMYRAASEEQLLASCDNFAIDDEYDLSRGLNKV